MCVFLSFYVKTDGRDSGRTGNTFIPGKYLISPGNFKCFRNQFFYPCEALRLKDFLNVKEINPFLPTIIAKMVNTVFSRIPRTIIRRKLCYRAVGIEPDIKIDSCFYNHCAIKLCLYWFLSNLILLSRLNE